MIDLQITSRIQIKTFLVSILLAIFAGVSCEEPEPCRSDADCREGYRCDLQVYVGECIKAVRVVRCGEFLCQAPEVCINGERCEEVERRDQGLNGGIEIPLGGQSLGGMSGGDDIGSGMEMDRQAGEMSGGSMALDRGSPSGQDMDDAGMESLDRGVVDMFVDPLDQDQGSRDCESACDCTPGQTCTDGRCTSASAPTYCCEGGFCPSGEACQFESGSMAICPEDPCNSACDCDPGLSCLAGVCQLGSSPVFCCDQGTCPDGMACESLSGVRGMCPSSGCRTACDCPTGQNCLGGSCVFDEEPIFCCDSGSCPAGATCETTMGMIGMCEASACQSACDCNPGLSCEMGSCVLGSSPVFCCGSASCPLDEQCEPPTGGPLQRCE